MDVLRCQDQYRVGDVVKGRFMDNQWYLAEVKRKNGDGTYTLAWLDGDTSDCTKRANEMKLMEYRPGAQSYREVQHFEERQPGEGRATSELRLLAACPQGPSVEPERCSGRGKDGGSPRAHGHVRLALEQRRSFAEAVEFEMHFVVSGKPRRPSEAETGCCIVSVAVDPEPRNKSWPPCLRGAVVERWEVRCDENARFRAHGLPSDQHFLVALEAHLKAGGTLRSDWVRCETLPSAGESHGDVDDFFSLTRGECADSQCESFLLLPHPLGQDDEASHALCRRCGCPASAHRLTRERVLVTPGRTPSSSAHLEVGVSLPREACSWGQRELSLFLSSRGQFHPSEMARRRRLRGSGGHPGRASVVSPTTESRQALHPQLWAVFNAQEWHDKELVIVETFHRSPSSFFVQKAEEDERLVYIPLKVPRGGDFYIGLKRNMCTHLSSGEYIVNFDDDDLYAPNYIDTMISAMREQSCEAITLRSWFVFEAFSGKIGHVDPLAALARAHCSPELADHWVFGYGFSYAFTRALAMALRYPHCDLGEDYEFMKFVRLRNLQAASPKVEHAGGDASRIGEEEETDAGDLSCDVNAHKAWVEETDAETCATLYRNTVTGEVRWDPPAAFTPQSVARLNKSGKAAQTSPCPLALTFLDRAGVALHADVSGICLHTLHAKSTSGKEADLDTLRLMAPLEVSEAEASGLQFTRLAEVYWAYLDQFPRTRRTSSNFRGHQGSSGAPLA